MFNLKNNILFFTLLTFSILYTYFIQNFINYSQSTFIIYIGIGYLIILVWLVFFFFNLYKIKKDKISINKKSNLYGLLSFFSFLYLIQNVKTTFVYNYFNILYLTIYILFFIIFICSIYIIYKLLDKKGSYKNILFTWLGIVLFYTFFLGRPTYPQVPNTFFYTEKGIEFLDLSYISYREGCMNNSKRIPLNSYPVRLNIPFIINFSNLYNFQKKMLFNYYHGNSFPEVTMQKYGKEIFTNLYMKNLIYNYYLSYDKLERDFMIINKENCK